MFIGGEEANRLNLESFIEATELGKLTYEACGFVYGGTNSLDSAKYNASPKWKELEIFMQYVFIIYDLFSASRAEIFCVCLCVVTVANLFSFFSFASQSLFA